MAAKYENAIKNRYEFVMLFDVENGNPNGDPDAGNMPRTDVETGFGIITDVCLKRKIRNFVELLKGDEDGYKILIKNDKPLNAKFADAYKEKGLKKDSKNKDDKSVLSAREYMCEQYYDVRTFGAVMNTGDDPCGIVRGPVQLNFARSIDNVNVQEISVTRQAVTTEKDYGENKRNTFGTKFIVPYALYRAEGYVSALLAMNDTGFSEADLDLLWQAIINMFEHDHAAARGKMTMRALYVFKHESALGNAPAHKLFDAVTVTRKDGVEYPRSFSDYTVAVDQDSIPQSVKFESKL